MSPTLLPEYPVTIGQRELYVFKAVGPSSYSQTTGDAINLPPGMYLDSVTGAMSVSKTYTVRPYPSATGTRPTWTFKWYASSNGAEVNNGVDLSGESVQFEAVGGAF